MVYVTHFCVSLLIWFFVCLLWRLPERAWEPAAPLPPKLISSEEEGPAGEGEEEQEEELMVPQVKVAEDGSLIIDEERSEEFQKRWIELFTFMFLVKHAVILNVSLTVEVQRSKGPNTIQDRDPIFERGSTTTYSSFRKGTHTKPWSIEGTSDPGDVRVLVLVFWFTKCSLLVFVRDGHVLPGHQHGRNGLLHDLSALHSQSSLRDKGQWLELVCILET